MMLPPKMKAFYYEIVDYTTKEEFSGLAFSSDTATAYDLYEVLKQKHHISKSERCMMADISFLFKL